MARLVAVVRAGDVEAEVGMEARPASGPWVSSPVEGRVTVLAGRACRNVAIYQCIAVLAKAVQVRFLIQG